MKDISRALLKILQPEYEGNHNAFDIEYDSFTMKTKLVVRPGIITIRLDEKSFFSTLFHFTSGWDCKYYNKYISQKILNSSSTNKIYLKCDIIDAFVLNGVRQPILFSFVLDKLPGYKIFCQPETIHYKKISKSVLKLTIFYLEDNNNEEVKYNGETLNFALQLIKF